MLRTNLLSALLLGFFFCPVSRCEQETKAIPNAFDKTNKELIYCLLKGKCKLANRTMQILGADHDIRDLVTLYLHYVGYEYTNNNKSATYIFRIDFFDRYSFEESHEFECKPKNRKYELIPMEETQDLIIWEAPLGGIPETYSLTYIVTKNPTTNKVESSITNKPVFMHKNGFKHRQLQKIQAFLDDHYEELTNKKDYYTPSQMLGRKIVFAVKKIYKNLKNR